MRSRFSKLLLKKLRFILRISFKNHNIIHPLNIHNYKWHSLHTLPYITLSHRRPRTSWAGQGPARDTPSPAFSLRDQRDPVYDGVGPRTSADGSSHRDLNKSVDSTGSSLPRGAKYGGTGAGHPSLIPYCPPIEEECPQTPKLPQTVHFNGVPSQDQVCTENSA